MCRASSTSSACSLRARSEITRAETLEVLAVRDRKVELQAMLAERHRLLAEKQAEVENALGDDEDDAATISRLKVGGGRVDVVTCEE